MLVGGARVANVKRVAAVIALLFEDESAHGAGSRIRGEEVSALAPLLEQPDRGLRVICRHHDPTASWKS